ncbi:RRP12-like protein [Chenopodium quinoa]|uniref:RRP12-like protein n=1 Tax=Chenopodium quinoa TaxID=63459 RepID=UPI000B76F90C|nr:RRP12-like protein [Chenopodium quinoa]
MDMEIEGLGLEEFDPIEEQTEDFCTSIISQFGKSNNEQHLNLCNVIGTMSQGLKDNNVPLLPAAYFGSIVSSLDRLCVSSDSSSTSPDHNVEALLTLMSLIMPRIPVGSLRKRKVLLLDLLIRVLRGGSSLSTDAVVAGLSCVSGLLVIRDSLNWSDVSQYYGFLLGFVTHSDSKVRKQSHICIRDVLQSFQRCPLLAPASEGFTSMFQKLVLLAGASKGAPAEIAQEILHVLEALKDCLPYISMKYKTSILKYYKTLLGVRKPLVTRRITDSLYVLCLDPSVEVKPEDLVDLLSTLATSVPVDETSADGMNFTARLLDVGMRKVYNLNRQICVDKLPLVLNALQDIFGSGFEEAKFAATESLKNLIQACVDEDLIKKGVDRANSNLDFNRKSAPSTIEKICATIGSLLDNRYRSEWDMAFQIVSLMFDKLGTFSSVLLRGSLESLASIEKDSEEDFPERKKLQDCIGSALGAVGPEVFLRILPLNLEADTLSDINGWLFPILKQYTVGASMRFYVESLLGTVENLKQKSKKLKLEGQVQASRYADRIVYQVWTLLPSFCNYPLDTAESFRLLEEVLCNALYKEPDLQGIICSSLQILIQQNKCILVGNNYVPSDKLNAPTERAIGFYNQEVASANLGVLRSSARNFLLVLFNAFLNSTNDPGGSLLSTIGEFASIAGEDTVSKLLRKEMKQLLKFTDDGNKRDAMEIDFSSGNNSFSFQRAQHFDLAVSLLPGLGPQDTDILFSSIIPALEDIDGLIQKKAYKVLSMILKNSDVFISRKIEEVLKLMSEVRSKCHFSAKRHRLDCLYFVIVHVIKDDAGWDKISPFIVEIVLALKEVNKKTRNRAYDILVQIGHACDEEKGGKKKDQGGKKKNLLQVFEKVAAGLASDCSHMISATVKGLARLAYEFSDCLSGACDLFSPSLLLLEREDKEIIKANLGLLKVLVAKSPSEILQIYLKGMVDGILVRQDDSMKHFKAKVKHLLEMLVKKCGLDAIKAVMPEDHMKLLTNIRKIKERKERKLAANSETSSYLSRATTSRQSGWGHTKIFSDFDEEFSDGDDMDAGTSVGRRSRSSSKLKSKAPSSRSRKTRSGRSLLEDSLDLEDEPLDLLDQRKTRLALRSGGNLKRKLDSEDEPEFDEDGRLIIREEGKPKSEKYDDNYEYDEDKTDVRSFVSSKSKKADQKRRKTSESGWAYTGNEYGSKKARGDVKKKGKFEPYAYWPLDRKMLSRRPEHRAAARRGMRSVVTLTKKLEGRSVASALSIKSKVKKAHKK